jgi:hypothetical protein
MLGQPQVEDPKAAAKKGAASKIPTNASAGDATSQLFLAKHAETDKAEKSLNKSVHEVGRLRGVRVLGKENWTKNRSSDGLLFEPAPVDVKNMLNSLQILEAQAACTEIRGGQAGGISCLETVAPFEAKMTRVRCVARKRHPLAADLAKLYQKNSGKLPSPANDVTFIGHTRFATSSVNTVPELHPHEWVPFHDEDVWVVRGSK